MRKSDKERFEEHLQIAQDNQIKPGVVAYQFGQAQLILNENESRENKRLGVFALLISVVALCLTAYFSYKDYVGDQEWQSEQLEELNEIKNLLEKDNT